MGSLGWPSAMGRGYQAGQSRVRHSPPTGRRLGLLRRAFPAAGSGDGYGLRYDTLWAFPHMLSGHFVGVSRLCWPLGRHSHRLRPGPMATSLRYDALRTLSAYVERGMAWALASYVGHSAGIATGFGRGRWPRRSVTMLCGLSAYVERGTAWASAGYVGTGQHSQRLRPGPMATSLRYDALRTTPHMLNGARRGRRPAMLGLASIANGFGRG